MRCHKFCNLQKVNRFKIKCENEVKMCWPAVFSCWHRSISSSSLVYLFSLGVEITSASAHGKQPGKLCSTLNSVAFESACMMKNRENWIFLMSDRITKLVMVQWKWVTFFVIAKIAEGFVLHMHSTFNEVTLSTLHYNWVKNTTQFPWPTTEYWTCLNFVINIEPISQMPFSWCLHTSKSSY